MVVLSPTSYTRPANTDARSAPTSPARMPFPEGAQAQEHPRALYIPDDPYPRMYVAGSPKPMVMYPRGSTVSQVSQCHPHYHPVLPLHCLPASRCLTHDVTYQTYDSWGTPELQLVHVEQAVCLYPPTCNRTENESRSAAAIQSSPPCSRPGKATLM
ncbi:hypothetical protein O3P69_009763 [Scylla paramamosain]|uniref:Uncharacterized protein n=1 Tax=Scylla paramamosain TaxID=85552 RepID=A0AAW0SNP1_SCYPA